jgi:4-hydroxybenzoate polyprenyltransferase
MADVLAGYLMVRRPETSLWVLPPLLLSSAAIYSGGCVLNDLCDREIDARERPSRPIPSGRVNPGRAAFFAGCCFAAGLAAAFAANLRSGCIAFLLLGCVIFYDAVVKGIPWMGPLFMGLCRALNLWMGLVVFGAIGRGLLIYPCVSLAYVFGLTMLSRYEVGGHPGSGAWVSPLCWLVVVAAVSTLTVLGPFRLAGLVFLGLFVLATGPPLGRAVLKPDPMRIQTAVKAMVLGIVLLDAAYVAGASGLGWGLVVLTCLLPSLALARYFYVT